MPQLSPDWTSPGYIAQAWYVMLLVLGSISLIYVIGKHQRWKGLPGPSVRQWNIGWADMTILICMLFTWATITGSLTAHFFPLGPDAPSSSKVWRTAFDGVLLQIGMALIFLSFWIYQPFHNRLSFNSEYMPLGTALRKAILFFLALMPVRMLLEMIWNSLLTNLQKLGLPLPMDTQEVVNDLSLSHSTGAYFLLIIVAGLLAPIVEEMVFRAGLYRFLKSRWGKQNAIFASAALFGLLHFNLLAFPTLMLLGTALCLAYEATGNIKVPIFMHAIFNLNTAFLVLLQS